MKNKFFLIPTGWPCTETMAVSYGHLETNKRVCGNRLAWVRSCDFPRWTSKQLCHCSTVRGEQRSSCSDSSLRTQVRDWFCNCSIGTGWGVWADKTENHPCTSEEIETKVVAMQKKQLQDGGGVFKWAFVPRFVLLAIFCFHFLWLSDKINAPLSTINHVTKTDSEACANI